MYMGTRPGIVRQGNRGSSTDTVKSFVDSEGLPVERIGADDVPYGNDKE